METFRPFFFSLFFFFFCTGTESRVCICRVSQGSYFWIWDSGMLVRSWKMDTMEQELCGYDSDEEKRDAMRKIVAVKWVFDSSSNFGSPGYIPDIKMISNFISIFIISPDSYPPFPFKLGVRRKIVREFNWVNRNTFPLSPTLTLIRPLIRSARPPFSALSIIYYRFLLRTLFTIYIWRKKA